MMSDHPLPWLLVPRARVIARSDLSLHLAHATVLDHWGIKHPEDYRLVVAPSVMVGTHNGQAEGDAIIGVELNVYFVRRTWLGRRWARFVFRLTGWRF